MHQSTRILRHSAALDFELMWQSHTKSTSKISPQHLNQHSPAIFQHLIHLFRPRKAHRTTFLFPRAPCHVVAIKNRHVAKSRAGVGPIPNGCLHCFLVQLRGDSLWLSMRAWTLIDLPVRLRLRLKNISEKMVSWNLITIDYIHLSIIYSLVNIQKTMEHHHSIDG